MKRIFTLLTFTSIATFQSIAQIGTFDSTFNDGYTYGLSNFFSDTKLVVTGNETFYAIGNNGMQTPDMNANYETAGLKSVTNDINAYCSSTSPVFIDYQDQFTSYTDFERLSDGKLVVLGWRRANNTSSGSLFCGRIGTNGVVESTFNGGYFYEYAETNIHVESEKVEVLSNGKILISATKNGGQILLIRLNNDGTLDPSFGANGITSFGAISGMASSINDLKVLSDGSFYLAGSDADPDNNNYVNGFVIKFNSDGTGDQNFGLHSLLTVNFGDLGNVSEVKSMAIQTNGNIVVAGYGNHIFPENNNSTQVAGLNIYNTSGSLISTYMHTLSGISNYAKVICLSNDKIIAGGVGRNPSENVKFIFSFFNSNGTVDNTQLTNGLVTYDPGIIGANIHDFALQPDGKLVFVAGVYGSQMNGFSGGTIAGRLLMSDSNNGGTNSLEDLVENQIKVYPNPANEEINIVGLKSQVLEIINSLGIVVLKTNIDENNPIQINSLNAGIYLIKLESGKVIPFVKR